MLEVTIVAEWRCDRCGTTARVAHEDGEKGSDPHSDMPPGWAWVSIDAPRTKEETREVCADCLARVRAVLEVTNAS